MSRRFNQLSLDQRYQIEALYKTKHKQKEIASILNVSASTISRELKRNTPRVGYKSKIYWATNAQRRTEKRHKAKPKRKKFTEELKEYCRNKLKRERLSPELIYALGKKELGDFVSHETIYKWIWNVKQSHSKKDREDVKLYQYLIHGRRRRKRGSIKDKRGQIPNRTFINERPIIVNKRKRAGDLEIDLMMGKRNKGALIVMTDRSTLWTRIRKVESKESVLVTSGICNALRKHKSWLKTFTFDNDVAFSMHQKIEKELGIKAYFARPYTSQDKGTVENRIGVIRRFFPKRTDLLNVTIQEVQFVEDQLNNRPIRKFNYKTPNKVFSEKIAFIS